MPTQSDRINQQMYAGTGQVICPLHGRLGPRGCNGCGPICVAVNPSVCCTHRGLSQQQPTSVLSGTCRTHCGLLRMGRIRECLSSVETALERPRRTCDAQRDLSPFKLPHCIDAVLSACIQNTSVGRYNRVDSKHAQEHCIAPDTEKAVHPALEHCFHLINCIAHLKASVSTCQPWQPSSSQWLLSFPPASQQPSQWRDALSRAQSHCQWHPLHVLHLQLELSPQQ